MLLYNVIGDLGCAVLATVALLGLAAVGWWLVVGGGAEGWYHGTPPEPRLPRLGAAVLCRSAGGETIGYPFRARAPQDSLNFFP